jgi:type II secretion system protein N
VNPRQKRILLGVGYAGFYLFALLLFAYLSFPYDRLRTRIESEFNARQTGPHPLTLKLGHVTSYWLSGVQATDVELISPPTPSSPGAADAKPSKPKIMRIDELHARVSLIRYLFGTTHVDFRADAFGGSLSGFTSDADNGRKLVVEIEDLNLADAPLIGDTIGLPVSGHLSGNIDLLLPEQKLSKAEGKVELTFSGLAIGDGKAKIQDTIALPKLDVGTLELAADAATGTLKITKLAAAGKDLDLAADGAIRLRDPFDSSQLGLTLAFKFSEKFTNKDDLTRSIFGAPGSPIPGVFDLDPSRKRAKRADGSYGWRVSGPIDKFQFTAAPEVSPGGARGK